MGDSLPSWGTHQRKGTEWSQFGMCIGFCYHVTNNHKLRGLKQFCESQAWHSQLCHVTWLNLGSELHHSHSPGRYPGYAHLGGLGRLSAILESFLPQWGLGNKEASGAVQEWARGWGVGESRVSQAERHKYTIQPNGRLRSRNCPCAFLLLSKGRVVPIPHGNKEQLWGGTQQMISIKRICLV